MYEEDRLNQNDTRVEDDPLQQKYYKETIINQKPKKSLTKFVVGILTVSLVGGGSIGASFAVATNLINNTEVAEKAISKEQPVSGNYQAMSAPITNPVSKIAKEVGPSVVSIINDQVVETVMGDFKQKGLGSGVIFKEDDSKVYIITNAHVVEGANTLTVTFLGNYKVKAELVGKDTLTDIAVVAVNKQEIPKEASAQIKVAPLGNSQDLKVGEVAVAIGTPVDEAYNNTVTVGVISALNRRVSVPDKELNLIQTDAAINPGNSGGALVGPSGEVMGINTIKLIDDGIEGMGFAIPINDVKPIVNEIMQEGRVKRPTLGITAQNMVESLGQTYEIPVGIFIIDVMPGSSADLAGIKPKDIILAFDGQKITTMEELKPLLKDKKVGDSIKVRLIRGGKKLDVSVQLKENVSAKAS